jgi:hypothetical protein
MTILTEMRWCSASKEEEGRQGSGLRPSSLLLDADALEGLRSLQEMGGGVRGRGRRPGGDLRAHARRVGESADKREALQVMATEDAAAAWLLGC